MGTEQKTTLLEQALVDKDIVLKHLEKTSSTVLGSLIKENFDNSIKKNLKLNEAEGDDENLDLDKEEEVETSEAPEGTEEVEGGEEAPELEPIEGDGIEGGEENVEADLDVELPIDGELEGGEGEEEVIDLTGIEDNEKGLEIFKKLGPNDLIDIVKDGQIKLIDPDTQEVYLLKPEALTESLNEENFFGDDDADFEVTIEDDEADSIINSLPRGGSPEYGVDEAIDLEEEIEITEDVEDLDETAIMGSRTHQTGRKQHGHVSNFPDSRLRPDQKNESKVLELTKELKALQESNEEYKKGIARLSETLKDVSVTHTNLLNSTRLILENSTTQKQKQKILEGFDKCKTIKQSNTLYESITKQLAENKPEKKTVVVETKVEQKGSLVEKQSYCSDELKENVMSIWDRMVILDSTKKNKK